MIVDTLSFIIRDSLPTMASNGDIVFVNGQTEDTNGLFVYSNSEWKNLLYARSGIQTRDLSQMFVNTNNALFVNVNSFINNDICTRLLLEINGGLTMDDKSIYGFINFIGTVKLSILFSNGQNVNVILNSNSYSLVGREIS